MPMSPQHFLAHARSAADAEGRLPAATELASWGTFPFELDGLRVVPLDELTLPEPARSDEDPTQCQTCARRDEGVWKDEHWRLACSGGSGAPLVLMLFSRDHYDLPTLPDARAAELGRLTAHLARAIESLPHIARAHVYRIGDGGAHLHVFFFARPEGLVQLRGSCLVLWDDLLPTVPAEVREADARSVATALATSYGGQVLA
jgi:diadenosine tetraphosphate (Ap4A) HIT family hydrolase